MVDTTRQRLGRWGESAAEGALTRSGMRVVARRFRRRFGEIDLIVEDGDTLVFVEVKTRRGTGCGHPAEAVTASKRRRLWKVAAAFLQLHGWLDRRCRFDVVEVLERAGGRPEVRHVQDAFRGWPTG